MTEEKSFLCGPRTARRTSRPPHSAKMFADTDGFDAAVPRTKPQYRSPRLAAHWKNVSAADAASRLGCCEDDDAGGRRSRVVRIPGPVNCHVGFIYQIRHAPRSRLFAVSGDLWKVVTFRRGVLLCAAYRQSPGSAHPLL